MLALIPRRLRWMLATAVGRWFVRRVTGRTVDAATDELADKLPDRVVKAADALPGDVMRAGGATLAAGRVAAKGIKVTSSKAKEQTQRNLEDIRSEIEIESEVARRSLWSDFLRFSGRPDEATDALLDVRGNRHTDDDTPAMFKRLPNPVTTGRKFLGKTKEESVSRVQRSFRPAKKPWD